MKKLLNNKNFIQKIMILLVAMILFNFTVPISSHAGIGGMLLEPISDLVTTIADAILSILQACLYNGSIVDSTNFGNILLGATYFYSGSAHYPEMAYDDHGNSDGVVEISEQELSQISFYDVATTIVNPIVGGIKLLTELTGITKTYNIPTIQYSVDKIFANKVPAFDINFINPTYNADNYIDADNDGRDDNTGYLKEDFEVRKNKSIAAILHNTIASWYVSLRNLAVVGLLSVLLYVGIRIVISSTASDKAKYKQMLMDWLVAMCLLFVLHYIMSFSITIINTITDTISKGSTVSIPVIIHTDGWNLGSLFQGDLKFNTDLTGLTRLQIQYEDFQRKLIYLILYVALVTYTVKYTWIYMKRTITMAFLTLMAPIVALTYPIDKLNDGKAQAFNSWFKEYIFTALLQPFHLIIYTILLGSAMNIATTNPIYAIMVLAFMGPAEKMLRKFFGFDKASTPGTLSQAGAMFGGAAAYGMMKKGISLITGGGKNKGGKDSIRTKPVEDNNAPSGYDALGESGWNANTSSDKTQEDNPPPSGQPLEGGGANTPPENQLPEGNGSQEGGANTPPENQPLEENSNPEEGANTPTESQPLEGDSDQGEGANISPENQPLEGNSNQGEGANTPSEDQPVEENNDQRQPTIRWKNVLPTANAIRRAPVNTIKEWGNEKFGNKEKTFRTLKNGAKSVGKFAGKVAVAGAVGAVGVGMGIAGDDLEDVLKYGAGGAILGGSVAPAVGRRIANSRLGQTVSRNAGRAYYGSDNAAQVAAQTARLRASGEIREQVANQFMDKNGNKPTGEALDKLENRAISHYNAGFTDASERKRVMKMEDKIKGQLDKNMSEEERDEKARRMAQTIGLLAKDIQPGKLTNKEYVNEKYEAFKNGIKNANPDLNQTAVEQNAKQSINLIMQYFKKDPYFK